MPAAVVAAISAIGATVGGAAGAFMIMNATAIATGLLFVGGLALSNYQRNKAKRKAIDQYNASQVDRLANVVTTVGPRELVLGRVRKAGNIYFRGTAGNNNETFLMHVALAGHEIDAVEQVYLNDQAVTLNGDGYVTNAPYAQTRRQSFSTPVPVGTTVIELNRTPVPGTVILTPHRASGDEEAGLPPPYTVVGRTVTISGSPNYKITISYQSDVVVYYARVWWELGSDDAVVDARTRALFPNLWTANHRARGVAKLMAEFTYNETAFPSGIPVISARIRGAKVYDPRTGTTAWSQNPALLARHVYQHPYFGKATVSVAEDERFIAAANACDTLHNYGSGNVPLYRAAVVVPFGTPARSAIDDLCQAMAGMSAFAAGELYIRAGVYTSPVMSLTDADLAVVQREGERERQDPISIAVHRERADKFNVVNARIWDSEQQYKLVALQPYKAAALIARDGQELAQEMHMPGVFYAPQAKHVAGVALRDARDALTFEAPFKLTAWPLELFDTVEVTLAHYGWTDKQFMVLKRVWDRERAVVRLLLKETAAEIFQPDAAFDPEGYSDNTSLPTPWTIEPPGTLVLSSGTAELALASDGTVITRVRVSWPLIEDQRIVAGGHVEVQWCDAVDEDLRWKATIVDGANTETYLAGVADGQTILVRARTRTDLALSDWGFMQSHVVVGKTEPPNPPTGVSLTQELVFFRRPSDADLAGVRIRSLPGIHAAPVFSRGTDVIDGLVLQSPARIERSLYGLQTVMVVSEDNSGNRSEPAFAVLDFGTPDIDSAVWDRDFAAESFPGAYSACELVGGVVLADLDPDSNLYGLDNLYGEPDVYAVVYQALTWTSDVVVPPYAGALTLQSTIQGNAPYVEYRISGDSTIDVYASDDVYAMSDVYGAPTAWTDWPGAMDVARTTAMEFRVSVGASSQRGEISEFTLSLVLQERSQTFANVVIDAAGTRLPPSDGSPPRNWIGSLRSVYGWPAADGSGAIAGRVLDFSTTLGPLVQFVNNLGDPVTGLGTVKVEGFSDE